MITPAVPICAPEVAAHYDRLDLFYREIWGKNLHHGLWRSGRETAEEATENLIEAAVESLAVRPGDSICDVGCGYGATARYLQERHGLRVTGVTNSRIQFEFARRQEDRTGGLDFIWGNWESTSLEAESFDGLISIECLSHVPDKREFFREIERVLKPGGRAVILDWMAGDHPDDWAIRHLLEPICRDGCLAALGTRAGYSEMIRESSLRLVGVDDLTPLTRRTWNVLASRIAAYGLTHPGAWRFVMDFPVTSWRFSLTIPRLIAAYRTRALRYGRFVIQKETLAE